MEKEYEVVIRDATGNFVEVISLGPDSLQDTIDSMYIGEMLEVRRIR